MIRALIIILLGASALQTMADNIEQPAFTSLGTIDAIEFRQYAPSIQARTPMAHSGQTNSGFRRLAGFIFGGNDQNMEIAMTAPVEETLEEQPTMAFTMPSEYQMEDLPAPDDGTVELVEVPARTVAVIMFSGWATGGKVAARTEDLLATLAEHNVETHGPPSLNQYNPPWTPPFMRKNEIIVGIAAVPSELLSSDRAGL
jgi:effector-binding domain-containing protein